MNDINLKIEQLENRSYKKSLDDAGQYLKGSELYFKKISDNNYIVFNHYNKGKKKYLQGFDCWISTYISENEIGKSKSLSNDLIKLSFDFEEDWQLLNSKIDEVQSTNV
ncbi:hypothetical protein SAMN05192540_3935 [Maribacter dokdonensis]|uniref:Uncharacterized protein n=1 Tax=Maribacter dokdonensis TaxID=320912 RepID=A0A1H4UWR6_9FLAO|nr:hypothetical protein [Maribacter dokdonensis]SEC73187.1 hypothetical protein SAMN05192540_3935 [Maribacter dokdonensis]